MDQPQIRFDDGAAYEHFMGTWSRLAGGVFIDWLAPPSRQRWIDVGCGNGAFTRMLVERCSPIDVHGIDPSRAQLDYAEARPATGSVEYRLGDAMALPYEDDAFDAAVMALVLSFVPDPARGVAEMARVVRPGGSVSAYMWDIPGGGFPYVVVQQEMAALGIETLLPPSVDASRIDAMRRLWKDAGLVQVETLEIGVERTFVDFDAFWAIAKTGPRIAPGVAAMSSGDVERLTESLRRRFAPDLGGRITCGARANAVKGVVPR